MAFDQEISIKDSRRSVRGWIKCSVTKIARPWMKFRSSHQQNQFDHVPPHGVDEGRVSIQRSSWCYSLLIPPSKYPLWKCTKQKSQVEWGGRWNGAFQDQWRLGVGPGFLIMVVFFLTLNRFEGALNWSQYSLTKQLVSALLRHEGGGIPSFAKTVHPRLRSCTDVKQYRYSIMLKDNL